MEDLGKNKKSISRRGLLLGVGATVVGGYGLKAEDWNPEQEIVRLSGPSKSDPEGYFSDFDKASSVLKGHESLELFFRGVNKNLINVGVAHKDVLYKTHSEIVYSIIENSDLVMLEYGVSGYFRDFAILCRDKKINYACLDASRSRIGNIILLVSDILLIYGLGRLDVKKALIGYSNGGFFSVQVDALLQSIENIIGIENRERMTTGGFSYVIDARNVFMATRLKRVIKENPDKKILVISGDSHASAIEKYIIDNKGNLTLLNDVYRLLYGWRHGLYKDPFADI